MVTIEPATPINGSTPHRGHLGPRSKTLPSPLRGPAPVRRLAFLALLFIAPSGCGGPPQIGVDQEAFKAVDALYTAVSLRDPTLLAECETNLRALNEAGKLPEAARKSLDSYIAEARGGGWESAQLRLADFMRGQR